MIGSPPDFPVLGKLAQVPVFMALLSDGQLSPERRRVARWLTNQSSVFVVMPALDGLDWKASAIFGDNLIMQAMRDL